MKTQQKGQQWDDIVFENRNKVYGAYAIRQSYPINVLRALLLCGGAIVGVFIWPPQSPTKALKDVTKSDIPHDPMPPPIINQDKPKETVHTQKTHGTRIPTKVITTDVPDVKPEDIVTANFTPSDNNEGTIDESGNDIASPIETVEPVKAQPFVVFAEVMPAYEGGNVEMIKFIQKKLHYPTYAARMKIAGIVYVSFVISVNGNVTHVEIVKGIDKSCDDEAMRVISMMTKWKPGMQNKMPVAVRMILPIKFVAGE